ncbi:TetR/AcrR family transcriptional regulator [Nonomuraea sp. 10N515B]|uniref:TetR/AcrR family transcriptional regulator n=1 Tax=Nonomuraea sp. 10N515B TaxID=3457422 RepID=UPI003FCE958F
MAGADTAARITAAARAILVAEGAAAVSMRKVAAEAGITPMATYRHFSNREVLLRTVAEECLRELDSEWAGRVAIADPQARILALLDDFLDFALGTPHLYAYVMADRRESARRFPEDFHIGQSSAFPRLMEAIELGMRKGFLRPDDVVEAALTISALVQGLIQLYLVGRIGLDEAGFRALCHRSVKRTLRGLAQ